MGTDSGHQPARGPFDGDQARVERLAIRADALDAGPDGQKVALHFDQHLTHRLLELGHRAPVVGNRLPGQRVHPAAGKERNVQLHADGPDRAALVERRQRLVLGPQGPRHQLQLRQGTSAVDFQAGQQRRQ